MSLEILEQLENRIQHLVHSVSILKEEIIALKKNNQELELLINDSSEEMESLKHENELLKKEKIIWQERMQSLLTKINEITK